MSNPITLHIRCIIWSYLEARLKRKGSWSDGVAEGEISKVELFPSKLKRAELLEIERNFKADILLFLSDRCWLKFYQIIWFLPLAPVSPCSRQGGKTSYVWPYGDLASSQRLSSSLFHHPGDFHLSQRPKRWGFFGGGGGGQPLGRTGMIGKDYIWISVGHLWKTSLWSLQRNSAYPWFL